MSYITRNHKQKIVYWGNPQQDGWGGYSFDDPVEIMGRWEDKQKMFLSSDGKEIISMAEVYLGQDVDLMGYLYLGELSEISSSEEGDPTSVSQAFPIRAFSKIPNLKGTLFERKAVLSDVGMD